MSSTGIDFDLKPGSRDGNSPRVNSTIRSGYHHRAHANAHKAFASKMLTHVDCCNDGQWPHRDNGACIGHQWSCQDKPRSTKFSNVTTDGFEFNLPYSLNKNNRWVNFSSPERLIATMTTDRCDDQMQFHVDAIELLENAMWKSAKAYAATTSADFGTIVNHRVATTGRLSGPSLIETIRNVHNLETKIRIGRSGSRIEQNREQPAPVIRFTVQKMNPNTEQFCRRLTRDNTINTTVQSTREKIHCKWSKEAAIDDEEIYDDVEDNDYASDSESEPDDNFEYVKRPGFNLGDFIDF